MFALPSRIAATLAASGAGSAAYRYCRLVNDPGSSIMLSSMRNPVRPLLALAVAALLSPLAAVAEPTPTAINVNVDQAKLVKLPSRVSTIVVGNPLIADVTLQNGGILVVTGKGYGSTNFIAMDRAGEVLVDRQIQVEGPTEELVTVYRGVDRETYSCTPVCQRRMTLGDGDNYFKSTSDQSTQMSSQAGGSATANKGNGN